MIKLAGRGGDFDLEKEFGISAERLAALDRVTQLAIAAGLDALRDAGIPLVMRYKTTSKGTQLPDHWGLPDALRDDTGVIFASVFPGFDSFADELARYYADRARRDQLAMLESMYARLVEARRPFHGGPGNGAADRRAARRHRNRSHTASTGASCSTYYRWAIRSSPNSSARAARTRKSTPPARAPPRPYRWPTIGSAPDGAAG